MPVPVSWGSQQHYHRFRNLSTSFRRQPPGIFTVVSCCFSAFLTVLKISWFFDVTDEILHILEISRNPHGWQGRLHVTEVTSSGNGSLVQNGNYASVCFSADCSAKALLQLDLHLRHHDGPDERMQVRIALLQLLC